MGGFSLGELAGVLRLDDSQYQAALAESAAASALLTVNIYKIGDSVQALDKELRGAGFNLKEVQGYLNSLRSQGLDTAGALGVLSNTIAELQMKVSSLTASSLASVSRTVNAEEEAAAAAVYAEQARIAALMKRASVEDKLDIDAKRRVAEMLGRDASAVIEIQQAEATALKQREALEASAAVRRSEIIAAEMAETEAAFAIETKWDARAAADRVAIEAGAATRRTEILVAETKEAESLFAQEAAAFAESTAVRTRLEAGAATRRTEILAAELARAEAMYVTENAANAAASAGGIGMRLGVGSGGIRPHGYVSGGGMMAAGIAAFGGYEMVKQAADFETALAKVKAVIGDVSDAMSSRMSTAALNLSEQFGYSAKSIVQEFATMSKAEVDFEQQFKTLPVLVEFARATNTELDKSAKLVLTVMNTLKIPFDEINTVTNQFVLANRMAIGSVDDFAKAIEGRAGAAFRSSKTSLADALAMTVVFARAGVESNIAQTALTQTVMKMTTSVVKHGEVMLDVAGKQTKWHDIIYNSNGELNKMSAVFQTLDKAFTGQSTEKITAFFNAIGLSGQRDVYVKSLLGMGDALEEVGNKMDQVSGQRAKSLAEAMKAPTVQFEKAKEAIRNAGIELGASLLPVAVKLADLFSTIAKGITVMSDLAHGDFKSLHATAPYAEGKAVPKLGGYDSNGEVIKSRDQYLEDLQKYAAGALEFAKKTSSASNAVSEAASEEAYARYSAAKRIIASIKEQVAAEKELEDTKHPKSGSSSNPTGDLFTDPAATEKAERKRLAAAARAYAIEQQTITNDENAAKAKLRIQLMNDSLSDTEEEASINRKRDRLLKYNDDVLAITIAANQRRLDAEKGASGDRTDLHIEGENAQAKAKNEEDRIRITQEASDKIRSILEKDGKEEVRIRQQQADEERRLDIQKNNDHVRALQTEIAATMQHGVAVMELAKQRADFEYDMGLRTKASKLKLDREVENDEYTLQKNAIGREIDLLNERQNRVGSQDEAIQSKKASLLADLQRLEDGHASKLEGYRQQELQGLDALGEAMVRLEIEQRKLAEMGPQTDRLIDLTNAEIRTKALTVVSEGLGGVYRDLWKTFQSTFGQIGGVLVDSIADIDHFSKHWADAGKAIAKSIATDIIGSLLKLAASKILVLIGLGVDPAAVKQAQNTATMVVLSGNLRLNTDAVAEDTIAEDANTAALNRLTAAIQDMANGGFGGMSGGGLGAFLLGLIPGAGAVTGVAQLGGGGSSSSIGSFDVGGFIPRTQVAKIHAGEYVMTPRLTAGLTDMLNGGGGMGDNFNFAGAHFGPSLTPSDMRGIMTGVVSQLRRVGTRTKTGKL